MAKTLVTAYQPFQGRGKNGSATLLRWLRRHWDRAESASEILPVDWVVAPQRFRRLVKTHVPCCFLGMGEGQPNRVALEVRAQNRMQGTDETGRSRPERPIQPIGPRELLSTMVGPSQKIVSLLPPAVPFVLSQDAGVYLCNRLLWAGLQTAVPRVGFLHIPPQGQTPDAAYTEALGPFVLALLQHNQTQVRGK